MLTALILTLGCDDGGQYGYAGYDMVDHFPLDGERSWTYTNDDVEWKLIVEMTDDKVQVEDTTVRTFEYWQSDSLGQKATLLMTASFSSDTYDGVQIHGYEVISDPVEWDTANPGDDTGSGGDTGTTGFGPAELVEFDPPLVLADAKMAPGDTVETTTSGGTWTSEFKYQEECPNNWIAGENTWSCLYIELDDGDGDLDSGAKVGGRYWIAPRYGMSWFQFAGDSSKWVLARAEWSPEE